LRFGIILKLFFAFSLFLVFKKPVHDQKTADGIIAFTLQALPYPTTKLAAYPTYVHQPFFIPDGNGPG
jgi:hypothetical protein